MSSAEPDPQSILDEPAMIGRVRRLVAARDVPLPEACAICGAATTDTCWFHLECDHSRPLVAPLSDPRPSFLRGFANLFVRGCPGDAVQTTTLEWRPLDVPLRIHAACRRERLPGLSERALRMLLQVVPLYTALLAAHPGTRIELVEPVDP